MANNNQGRYGGICCCGGNSQVIQPINTNKVAPLILIQNNQIQSISDNQNPQNNENQSRQTNEITIQQNPNQKMSIMEYNSPNQHQISQDQKSDQSSVKIQTEEIQVPHENEKGKEKDEEKEAIQSNNNQIPEGEIKFEEAQMQNQKINEPQNSFQNRQDLKIRNFDETVVITNLATGLSSPNSNTLQFTSKAIELHQILEKQNSNQGKEVQVKKVQSQEIKQINEVQGVEDSKISNSSQSSAHSTQREEDRITEIYTHFMSQYEQRGNESNRIYGDFELKSIEGSLIIFDLLRKPNKRDTFYVFSSKDTQAITSFRQGQRRVLLADGEYQGKLVYYFKQKQPSINQSS